MKSLTKKCLQFLEIMRYFWGKALTCAKKGKIMKNYTSKAIKVLMAGGMAFSTMSSQNVFLLAKEDSNDAGIINLAKGKTATASEEEPGTKFLAKNAVDGIVNRDAANKADQSRWGTAQLNGTEEAWLKVDLGEKQVFQSFVIAWERRNITGYKIQISETGEDTSNWETVYEKTSDTEISDVIETIHLDKAVNARYVRLLIDGYNGKHVVGNENAEWKSVSLYEFQIYENEIPNDLLPSENYNLEGKATASDFETGTAFTADKAIDGNRKDKASRWATNTSGTGEDRALTIELPVSQRVQAFKIFWERTNIDGYTISVSNDGKEYTEVYKKDKAITETDEVIALDKAVWAKFIRLNVTDYNGGSISWPNVSLYEFESYAKAPAKENPEINESDSAKEAAAKLKEAPEWNEDHSAFLMPEAPEGFKIEFLADYEQIVTKDGKVYQPLTQTNIKGIYKVTKGNESAESTKEFTITIPGKYENAGENNKPTVIPELAEWHGDTGSFKVAKNSRIVLDEKANDIAYFAAKELQKDYKEQTGIELEIVKTTETKPGDIYFTKDEENNLGKEGYIMDIKDVVTVKAEQSTGAYWATRSILQILKLNENTMPKGITRDYPKYEVRGFSIDVARKPISMEMLNSMAKEMAYYKMNDFQIHLNDNLIFYEDYASVEEAMQKAYTGFRLESDIKKGEVIEGDSKGVKNAADLTNEDLSYSKKDFRNFILNSRSMGVNIVPEFDAPGHSGAFMDVRPDLHLKKTIEGNSKRAGEQFDLSDEHYADSVNFVEKLWDEYLNDDMFDSSMVVHVGTDEYYGDAEAFRKFSDDIIGHVQEKNPVVRMWGSLSHKKGTTPVRSKNVQMNCWYNPYAQPKDMYEQGYQLINTIDGDLYIVPSAGYYGDYLNTQRLYNNWQVNVIGGQAIPSASEQMLGSTFAVWNDSVDTRANGITEIDVYDRFIKALPTLATKNWGDPKEMSYEDMNQGLKQLEDAPGNNPYNKETAKDGSYMEYTFNKGKEKEDSTTNDRDLLEEKNVDIKNGELTLSGDESYVTTPIDKLATGNTLEFDITLTKEAKPGEILFEADHEGNDLMSHDIRIMDDGTLGFTRELYDYSFGYKLPVGEKVHLAISTDGIHTVLIVDGEKYNAVGKYVDANGIEKKTDIKAGVQLGGKGGGTGVATLLLPLERIGSSTNAIDAKIDNVRVVEGAYKDASIIDSSEFVVTSDNEQAVTGSEGPIAFAFDNNPSTIWHTSYSPYKGLPATVTIDMKKEYEINKFSYLPRSSGTNGNITEYSLYYKQSENDEWKPLVENATWAANGEEKSIKFDAVNARYLKFVAHHGMSDGSNEFASAAEFRVHKTMDDVVEVNKDELQKLVDEAVSDFSAYTEESVAAYKEALTSAKEVLANPNATQEEVNAAVERLKGAQLVKKTYTVKINGKVYTVKHGDKLEKPEDPQKEGYRFVGWYVNDEEFDFTKPVTENLEIVARFEKIENPVIVDKTELMNLVVHAVKDFTGYTQESVDAYKEALAYAKKVLSDPNATQEEVDKAIKGLKAAVLEKIENTDKPGKPVDEDKEKDDPKTGVTTNSTMFMGTLLAALGAMFVTNKKRKED